MAERPTLPGQRGGNGLLMHTYGHGDLGATLAFHEDERGAESGALAHVVGALGHLQVALHCFTVAGRHDKTQNVYAGMR